MKQQIMALQTSNWCMLKLLDVSREADWYPDETAPTRKGVRSPGIRTLKHSCELFDSMLQAAKPEDGLPKILLLADTAAIEAYNAAGLPPTPENRELIDASRGQDEKLVIRPLYHTPGMNL